MDTELISALAKFISPFAYIGVLVWLATEAVKKWQKLTGTLLRLCPFVVAVGLCYLNNFVAPGLAGTIVFMKVVPNPVTYGLIMGWLTSVGYKIAFKKE